MSRTPRPAADVRVDPELVRALVRGQFPQLAGLEVRFADDGWDNAIYRLGPDLAVRLPRRDLAHALLLNEIRWLPFLAPRLPLQVPVPLHRGKPGEGYPYHWVVVPWLSGRSAATVPAQVRDDYAPALAAFFRALHVPAPADAPRNAVRGVPLRERDEAVRSRLQAVPAPERGALLSIWEQGLAADGHVGARLWLHGDPHPHNMLVRDEAAGGEGRPAERLGAVIDFGDLTAGDPASDLAVAWLHFTPRGRAEFRERLEGHRLYSPGTWIRARAWAANYAALMSGLPQDDPLHGVGAHGIDHLLSDS
ncbi:aminoglycoside phosphotransferase family protein [Paeniglutamicibacter sp. ABSL32-1]|uniref:aminoglycoside phosphotransferase family protein n=1 Tax=Paeniglutamicibacter quisquiliarum TaxID=2849498 RepID=UPI001C2D43A3|nr:aminoglycoside phosphotransferase family protein [Paeniglutamicibacter quisquiliarum]